MSDNAIGKTEAAVKGKLFVSFWHIVLENLPLGAFVHRCLTAEDARLMIEEARRERRLCCASQDDLVAPYKKAALQNHRQLCAVMSAHFGIAIAADDFLSEIDEDGERLYSIVPLQCVEVRNEHKLIVVTCCYTLPESDKRSKPLDFAIAPDSVEFHLFEMAATTSSVRMDGRDVEA